MKLTLENLLEVDGVVTHPKDGFDCISSSFSPNTPTDTRTITGLRLSPGPNLRKPGNSGVTVGLMAKVAQKIADNLTDPLAGFGDVPCIGGGGARSIADVGATNPTDAATVGDVGQLHVQPEVCSNYHEGFGAGYMGRFAVIKAGSLAEKGYIEGKKRREVEDEYRNKPIPKNTAMRIPPLDASDYKTAPAGGYIGSLSERLDAALRPDPENSRLWPWPK